MYDSSDDERPKTPPPVLHRHTHIESHNGRTTTQQMLYTMPGSPDSSAINARPTPIATTHDADDLIFNGIPSEEVTDHVEESRGDNCQVRH